MSDFVFILQKEAENCLPVERAMLVKMDGDRQAISLSNSDVPVPDSLRHTIFALKSTGTFIETAVGFSALLLSRDDDTIVLAGKWKKPRRRLNLDEQVWLETMMNYAQLVMENLYKTEELMDAFKHLETNRQSLSMTTKKFIFKISERERRQLSQDLHDTNLQDQLAVARDIDAEKEKVSDPAVVYFLENIRERILDNVHVLRKVINDLRPDFIQRLGLVKSLAILFEQTNLRSNFVLQEQIDEELMIEDKEIEIALYRVIQEMLNNAMKHSGAAHVRLTLTQRDRRCVLDYLDDGTGIDLKGWIVHSAQWVSRG
ncbi:histidine kinase [Terrilactibacillus sp. S3-3]|nr:histidine kinase [Terrilactibacillus sp. S3-3]